MNGKRKVKVEPKLSMLSIQIAQRLEEGGLYLHENPDGSKIKESWIKEQLEKYLTDTKERLNNDLTDILDKVKEMPDAKNVIDSTLQKYNPMGLDHLSNTPDDIKPQVLETLNDVFSDADEYRTQEKMELKKSLQIIDIMTDKLEAVFNKTAGYVDIFHKDLNKYSTVIRRMKLDGVSPSEMVMVHIGDSITDKIPTENTGPGEVNEGAGDVFLVGMQNSSEDLRKIIHARDIPGKKRGFITARREVLGVNDVFFGIKKVVAESIGEE
jgi:hypothetical protein